MATGNRGVRSKPRFYDWLIAQIDSNRYTGVFWIDDEHTTFRIPWKSLKLNVFEEDIAIFKAWARASLKYNEAVSDRYKWKHNFHSSLKSIIVNDKRVFTEVHNHSNNPADPHKVFSIHHAAAFRPAPGGFSTAPGPHDFGLNRHTKERGQNNEKNPPQDASTPLDQELTRVFETISSSNDVTAEDALFRTHDWASGGSTQMVPVASRASLVTENQPEENSFYGIGFQPTSNLAVEYNPIWRDFTCPPALYQLEHLMTQSPHGQISLAIQPPCPGRMNRHDNDEKVKPAELTSEKDTSQQQRVTKNTLNASVKSPSRKRARSSENRSNEQAVHDPSANGTSQGAGAIPVTQGLSSGMAREGAIQHGQAPPAADNNWKPDDLLCSLQLSIYYRRKHMLRLLVNHNRCLLSYNQAISNLGPHEPVCFPSPASLPDQKQILYTTRILEAIQEGLLLEVNRDQKKIYATWLGSTHYKVFWASAGQLARLASIPPPEFLQKNIATEIFNFQTFLKELEEYKKGQRRSPDFTIYLCFGQRFSVKMPKEEKLVLVEIVPQFCVFRYESVQQHYGVSSLNSLITNLQIPSLFQLIEMISSGGW